MHENHHDKDLPENRQDGKGLAGAGHVHEGAQNVQRQKRNNGGVQNLINNTRKVFHRFIQGRPDFLALHCRETQTQNKGKYHSGERIEQRWNGDTEEGAYRLVCRRTDFLHGIRRHKTRKQIDGNQIRNRTANQSRAVCQDDRKQQQFSRSLRQICNSHRHIGENHERNDKLQEIAEDPGQCNDQLAKTERCILPD